jgi:hypothetical protein
MGIIDSWLKTRVFNVRNPKPFSSLLLSSLELSDTKVYEPETLGPETWILHPEPQTPQKQPTVPFVQM